MNKTEKSILLSTKKLLGIAEDDKSFDTDIILHINSVFTVLYQMGLGEEDDPIFIRDENAYWRDFFTEDSNVEAIKSYMGFKVQKMFDPPSSSIHMEALNNNINEMEWRITQQLENGTIQTITTEERIEALEKWKKEDRILWKILVGEKE